ncbi:MAG TPA: response regulator transcription factor [Candidatus Manganitrophaceae bacterium]|nr:response regulator transcription factor [Candidatus Manganitrophaceae bacterium]
MPTLLKKRTRSRSKDADRMTLRPEARPLSQREREVVKLVAEGYKNKEAAEMLGISVKTIETHRANIMNKLALRNVAQLVHYAIQKEIIDIKLD